MKYAAININFDSLSEAYGFPRKYNDPSFTRIANRFLEIADKFGFNYSIYVIGKDLEKESNRAEVKRWFDAGHEIGNHSWSHPLNLGSLPRATILDEVRRSHVAIEETIGEPPRGFIAPGWSTSRALKDVLLALDYEYDTSDFPSFLMYPSLLKMAWNHLGDRRFFKIFKRRDYLVSLLGSRKPVEHRGAEGSLMLMPLPTTKARIACWHTTAFVFGWRRHEQILFSCLRDLPYFYYLVHPADLVEANDLDPCRKCHLERVGGSLDHKMELFERSLARIVESGRKLVTMRELALRAREDLSK